LAEERREVVSSIRRALCNLGIHVPSEDAVWNRGFFFGACRHCGTDLVRTAAGKWHVPKGQKVVWKTRNPRGRRPGQEPETPAEEPPAQQPEGAAGEGGGGD
jgi:hypothetical protein